MNTSKSYQSIDNSPWTSWQVGKRHNHERQVWDPYTSKLQLEKKRVTFNMNKKASMKYELMKQSEESMKRRNLGMSMPLRSQFKSKRSSSKFVPDMIHDYSETHASFRSPGREKPIPLPSGRNQNIHIMKQDLVFQHDLHEPRKKMDAVIKLEKLKAKILAGEYVSMDTIQAAKEELKKTDDNWTLKIHEISNKEIRQLEKRKLFCDKGIVKVPTPHTPATPYNTFGSPADLRISLSNSETPEYIGRRRFFFDFTGFLDKDISLYLEGNRRLVIKGNRPKRCTKEAAKLVETINLPRDLPVDNLRIVRDVFGILIVEEAWKFL